MTLNLWEKNGILHHQDFKELQEVLNEIFEVIEKQPNNSIAKCLAHDNISNLLFSNSKEGVNN